MKQQQNLGAAGEAFVASLLEKKGYRILVKNYHSRWGELDIIAVRSPYLVFVEVKTRHPGAAVSPLEAVTAGKKRRLRKTAEQYLQQHPELAKLQPRFDVVGVEMRSDETPLHLNHIVNAF